MRPTNQSGDTLTGMTRGGSSSAVQEEFGMTQFRRPAITGLDQAHAKLSFVDECEERAKAEGGIQLGATEPQAETRR